jgi:hypothetical protein
VRQLRIPDMLTHIADGVPLRRVRSQQMTN